MPRLRDPSSLTHAQLTTVVRSVQNILWPGGDMESQWSSDEIDMVANALARAGLDKPAPAKRAAAPKRR